MSCQNLSQKKVTFRVVREAFADHFFSTSMVSHPVLNPLQGPFDRFSNARYYTGFWNQRVLMWYLQYFGNNVLVFVFKEGQKQEFAFSLGFKKI